VLKLIFISILDKRKRLFIKNQRTSSNTNKKLDFLNYLFLARIKED